MIGHQTENQIETLNSLLRGELAATETYLQALARFEGHPDAADLREIMVDHRETANTLRQHIHQLGGKPDQDSGAWGMFARAVEGTAKAFGRTAALKALKEGEESGLHTYEELAADEELPPECLTILRTQLLPQTRAHIATLDRLMEAQ